MCMLSRLHWRRPYKLYTSSPSATETSVFPLSRTPMVLTCHIALQSTRPLQQRSAWTQLEKELLDLRVQNTRPEAELPSESVAKGDPSGHEFLQLPTAVMHSDRRVLALQLAHRRHASAQAGCKSHIAHRIQWPERHRCVQRCFYIVCWPDTTLLV